MPYILTEEQESFKASLRRFLESRSDEAEVRRLIEEDAGYDVDVWSMMALQLGLQGMQVPEVHGGTGFGHRELAIALEEMGRVLYSGPFFSTVVLAVNALLESCDKHAQEAFLPAIAAGECLATVAIAEDDGGWDPDRVRLQARAVGSGEFRLDGIKNFVLDGHIADLILVHAIADTGPGLFAVSSAALGGGELIRTRVPSLDLTRRQAHLQFDDVRAEQVGEPGRGNALLRTVLALAGVALAAEQVGGAQRCLDMAVDYAKQRIQFGRPIGSFQAIKHKCARMSLRVEAARSASLYAAWCADADRERLHAEASVAQAYCSEAYMHAASENLQIHGGIGFTWDHAAHLYLRRAKFSELLLGDGRHHRERLIAHLSRGGAATAAETTAASPEEGGGPVGEDHATFRAEVRRWLAARLPPARSGTADTPLEFMGVGEGVEAIPAARSYLATLAENGWGAPSWPPEYGGAGLSPAQVQVLNDELRAFETPDLYMFSVGLRHAGSAILSYGEEEQKLAWLPRIARGEDIWCQMFSEPGAGSDLAALAAKAEQVKGGWRVSGQKVWVSRAHAADWGLLLARTDPTVPKHRGITAFALDMSAEGIDVRPLRQINGDEHFNEVFFDAVWIPDAHRVGAVGDGWRVAVAMLAGERTQTGGVGAAFGDDAVLVRRLTGLVRDSGALDDPTVGQELAEVIIEATLAERTAARAIAAATAGKAVEAEGSGDKLRKAATLKRAAALALSVQRAAGTTDSEWSNLFLSAPSMSIRGGTDEILLNVIGERVLGLPPEPRVDKGIPFAEVPR